MIHIISITGVCLLNLFMHSYKNISFQLGIRRNPPENFFIPKTPYILDFQKYYFNVARFLATGYDTAGLMS